MKKVDPVYLGDGLYASFDGQMVSIHLGAHDAPPVAFFDREVAQAFIRYALKTELILSGHLDEMGDQ